MVVHSKNQAQVRTLLFDKAFIKVPVEYSDYNNVFSAENVAELPKNTKMNKHTIKLEEDKQSSFRFIYSLGLIELKTLKTYIEINLFNSFIWLDKISIEALILFDKKPDKSLHLYIDYQSLNNITIKN